MEEPHVFVAELEPGPVHDIYQVADARRLTARNGKPYLAMTLRDNSGSISAKRWDATEEQASIATVGAFLEIRGEVEIYREQPQLVIAAMRTAVSEDIEREAFEHSPEFDPAELLDEVRGMLESLEDDDYRRIGEAYLADEAFMDRFETGPAARMMHHPYRFGLLEHVHSVLKLGELMCGHYPWLDRSLVLLGLFLHDSGKVVELRGEETPEYSFEGELLGHITIGINMLDRKLQELGDIPPRKAVFLKHVILSHHDRAEYGSPKPPMIAEAQLIHAIEMLDAKLNAFQREAAQAPESRDELGGLRYSKLLHRRIVTEHPAPEGENES